MTRPDVGKHSQDCAHNTDAPGRTREHEIAQAADEEARQEARRRLKKLEWLQAYLKKGKQK